MIKRILLLSMIFIFLNTNLLGVGERLNIESARIHKLGVIIKRVNTLYEFINLYIMQTGTIPANMTALQAKYSGLVISGFKSSNTIAFGVLNNIVTFTNVVPLDSSTSPLSSIVKQVYLNHSKLHENAIVNADLSISIQLKPQTIEFLSTVNILNIRFPSVVIQENTPTCDVAHNGQVWYQPDVMGGYFIQYCDDGTSYLPPLAPNWVNMSNNIDTALYIGSLSRLNAIIPPTGTRAYIPVGSDLREYIYTGSTNHWKPVKY